MSSVRTHVRQVPGLPGESADAVRMGQIESDLADLETALDGTVSALPEILVDVTGDGTTDNLTMIQNALDDAGTLVGDRYGRTVVLNTTGDVGVSAQPVAPKGVTLAGRGARATRLLALPGFADDYVLKMGAGDSEFEHGIGVRDLIVDTGDQAGVGCIETNTANEPSAIERVLFRNARGRALSATSAAGPLTPSHIRITDCEVFQSLANASDETFYFDGVGNTVLIERTTLTNMGDAKTAGTRPIYAIRATGTNVVLEAVHFEQAEAGVLVTLGTGNLGGLLALGTTGHPSVDAIITLTDAAPTVALNTRSLGALVTIANSVTGESLTNTVAHYSNRAPTVPMSPRPVTTLTAHTTLLVEQHQWLVLVDASAASRIITLPLAASATGVEYVVKKIDSSANEVQLNPNMTELVDGMDRKGTTSQWGYLHVVCDGTGWRVIAQGGTIVDTP